MALRPGEWSAAHCSDKQATNLNKARQAWSSSQDQTARQLNEMLLAIRKTGSREVHNFFDVCCCYCGYECDPCSFLRSLALPSPGLRNLSAALLFHVASLTRERTGSTPFGVHLHIFARRRRQCGRCKKVPPSQLIGWSWSPSKAIVFPIDWF